MKIDIYTKLVLTAIAFSLIILAGKEVGLISPANASSNGVQLVEIVNMTAVPVFVDGGQLEVYGTVKTY